MKEKKARVEDAMHATKAAVEEGIVAGGGVALLRCIPTLEKVKAEKEEKVGIEIVKRALEEPIRQITNNAGWEGSVVVNKVKELDTNEGFNAEACEYGDMFKWGIIDPAKVVKNALLNASSVAALMLTTEALVWEKPEEEKAPAMPPGGGMPGGGMGGMY